MRDFIKTAITGTEINPNTLYTQIEAKSDDDKYGQIMGAYEELLRDFNSIDAEKRRALLTVLNNWVAE